MTALRSTLSMPGPRRRPPLMFVELQPGRYCCGDHSEAALELEVRGILAGRYAESSRVAAVRHRVAERYLRMPTERKQTLLWAFDWEARDYGVVP